MLINGKTRPFLLPLGQELCGLAVAASRVSKPSVSGCGLRGGCRKGLGTGPEEPSQLQPMESQL